jgi:antirestriction protein ArdC
VQVRLPYHVHRLSQEPSRAVWLQRQHLMKGYTVFNGEPTDGLPAYDDAPARDVRRLPSCEAFMD